MFMCEPCNKKDEHCRYGFEGHASTKSEGPCEACREVGVCVDCKCYKYFPKKLAPPKAESNKRESIPITDDESLHIGPSVKQECGIHDWPTEGLAKRLVKAMRDSHPKGVDACRDCLERAMAEAKGI